MDGGQGVVGSYDHGVDGLKLRAETIGAAFAATVARYGGSEAVVAPGAGVRWTWQALARRVDDFAAGLLALGLVPGDRVGIWAPNCVEWLVGAFALAKAGMICVTLNPAYRLTELDFALNKTGCRALIAARRFRSADFIALLGALMPELPLSRPGELAAAAVPALRWVIQIGEDAAPGCLAFDAVPLGALAAHRVALAEIGAGLQCDAPACIQFTSGTTGTPKGTVLSHHGMVNAAAQFAAGMRMGAADRLCVPVPFFHVFGYVGCAVAAAVTGSALVLPGPAFDALAVLETVHAERCTVLHGVPTMFLAELAHPAFDGFDLTCLRTGAMAGATCPESLMRQVVERMHMREIVCAFGMTETSGLISMTDAEDTLAHRVGTVGKVVPHREIKLIDAQGRLVPRGEVGELCVRGFTVMLGYWDDPARTAETIDAAGWLHTGDLAIMDADGYCRIVGRSKEMIKRGGEAIYPREIEEFLITHPGIREAHVFGVPHPFWGEEVCAWIGLRAGAEVDEAAVRAFCLDRISRQKTPAIIRFVEAFPMTGSGKVQKFVMRAAMIEEIGRA